MSKKSLLVTLSLCVACLLGGCSSTDSAATAESSTSPADGIVVKGNVEQVISKIENFEKSGKEYSGAEVTDKIAYIDWVDNEDGGLLSVTLSDNDDYILSKNYAHCFCGESETMQTYAELNEGDTVTVYGEAFLFDDGHLEMVDCDVIDNN